VTFEGMKPQPMRFSTSEGTTPFVFEGKTYFYVSDPGAAEWRSSTFTASEAWVPRKATVNREIGDLPHKIRAKGQLVLVRYGFRSVCPVMPPVVSQEV
jgi:hypothetical protein